MENYKIIKDTQILLDKIKNYFKQDEIMCNCLLYIDNLNTLNYIYANGLNRIDIYCVNNINN